MTTSDREKLARQWAEKTRDNFMSSSELEEAAADYILATTTPPTMEDVEWDDDIHRGLGAVDDAGQEWVMLQDDGPYISLIGLDLNPVGAKREELTPNGKRYELREKSDHPEVLETLEDYKNAPAKTLVCFHDCEPFLKEDDGGWTVQGGHPWSDEELEGTRRSVLRWGKGGEA